MAGENSQHESSGVEVEFNVERLGYEGDIYRHPRDASDETQPLIAAISAGNRPFSMIGIPFHWVHNLISIHVLKQSNLLKNDVTRLGVNAPFVDSFFMLVDICFRCITNSKYAPTKPNSLLSKEEIIERKIDSIAIDAVYSDTDYENDTATEN